jgi:O-acetyl-ADP-ribose deacetylase (regulator of RNase III)
VDAIVNAANSRLAGAITRSLELAVEHGCRSVALPALSAGAYGYPLAEAASVALHAAADFLRREGQPKLVRFVLFDERALVAFRDALETLQRGE